MTLPLKRFVQKILVNRRKQAKINDTIKQLRALSDHELNDIGLGRGDIYSVAHGDPTSVRASANKNLEGWV